MFFGAKLYILNSERYDRADNYHDPSNNNFRDNPMYLLYRVRQP